MLPWSAGRVEVPGSFGGSEDGGLRRRYPHIQPSLTWWRGGREARSVTATAAHTKAGEPSHGRQLLRRQPGTTRDQHQRAADGPDLELLAGRQRQLPRRPPGRRPARGVPGDRRERLRLGLPGLRVVRHLAGEAGIRQFLDIGTGLPTANNTHQVAQAVAPECRIVYVDNDPIVLTHARALLTSTPEGATDYIDADLRDPDTILPHAARTLDFTQLIAIMLMGILGHIADDEQAVDRQTALRRARRELPGR